MSKRDPVALAELVQAHGSSDSSPLDFELQLVAVGELGVDRVRQLHSPVARGVVKGGMRDRVVLLLFIAPSLGVTVDVGESE